MRMLHVPQGSLKVLGEHPALDLLNSIDTDRGRWIDFLEDPANIAEWALAAGLLDAAASASLKKRSAGDPALAAHVHTHILELRGALQALLRGSAQPTGLQAAINSALPAPLLGPDLALNVPAAEPERALLARLAFSAADLLLSRTGEQVRQCEAPHCDWFFLDQTGRRRWCLMQGCGNAAKARRHRARAKAAM